jgi:hypothetical protein
MRNVTIDHPQLEHEAVACHAYRLWEAAGRPAGQDQEYWFQAEAQLREMFRPTADTLKTAPRITTASALPSLPKEPVLPAAAPLRTVQSVPRKKRK